MRIPNLLTMLAPRRHDAGAAVRLTGARAPATPFEAWVVAEIAGTNSAPRGRLIARLAEKLLDEELRRGGAQVDAGIWGPVLFQREAARVLCQLEGDFIEAVAASPECSPRRTLAAAG